MAVQQWTSTGGGFESTPAGDTSPADGDDRIRELKETAGSLLDKEHIARDAGSTAAQGWHREGSAIAYYEAAAPANRPDAATALGATDAGRLWIDSDDGSLSFWNGSAWDALVPATTIMDQIALLTAAEIQQLQNIGAAAISAAEWGYLAALNQSLTTTSNVAFGSVTADVTGDLTGTADDADGVNETGTGAGVLVPKVINIGDWNMDTTVGVTVAHGLGASWKNIRSIDAIVRNDADDSYRQLNYYSAAVSGGITAVNSTTIGLGRVTGGWFDGAAYDATSFNRGWITIWYTS